MKTAVLLTLGLLMGLPALHRAHAARLTYTLHVLGMPAMEAGMSVDLTPESYQLAIRFQTIGLAGAAFRGHQEQRARGTFLGGRTLPREYDSTGTWRGQTRATRLVYVNDVPAVTAMTPPDDTDRDPVPAALLNRVIDPLSVIAELLRVIAETGRCDGAARTFDGRRVVVFTMKTAGEEDILPSPRSRFAGRALRCDFTHEVVAGLRRGEGRAADTGPRRGTLWLAPLVQGGRKLPVRGTMETRLIGDATMHLTAMEP